MRVLLPLLLAACADGDDRVVEPDGWQLLPAAAVDPWSPGATQTHCVTWKVADDALAIETHGCPWFTAIQSTAVDLAAGDVLSFTVAWDALDADEPGEAVMGVALDTTVAWEHVEAIPGEADHVEVALAIEHDVPVGTPLLVHVHDEGDHSYRWLGFERVR